MGDKRSEGTNLRIQTAIAAVFQLSFNKNETHRLPDKAHRYD